MACARNSLDLRGESDSHVRQRRPTRSAVIVQASHVYKKEADSFLHFFDDQPAGDLFLTPAADGTLTVTLPLQTYDVLYVD
jgi:hypothetical protein